MNYIGIDAGSTALVVARHDQRGGVTFANTTPDHRRLQRWLKRLAPVRVCIEATGVYSLDIALTLHNTDGVEVMVVNPRAAKCFAEALLARGKDDASCAERLAAFAARMPFTPWQPPAPQALALRRLAREATALTQDLVAARNRRHAAGRTNTTPRRLLAVLDRHIRQLEELIATLEAEARALIAADPRLDADRDLLVTIPGIADRSAVRILSELAGMAEPLMPRQLVAATGLDVIHVTSGTSVHKKPRLSKQGNAHLRHALYMPALVAIQRCPEARTFYQRLIANGKKPLQAIAAVMRKLLHAISAVLRYRTPFDAQKLFRTPVPA